MIQFVLAITCYVSKSSIQISSLKFFCASKQKQFAPSVQCLGLVNDTYDNTDGTPSLKKKNNCDIYISHLVLISQPE